MFVIIEKFKVSNEEPTAGETKLFEYSLQKLEPMDLSYVQLKSFTLPSYQAIFPNTPPSSDVSIEVKYYAIFEMLVSEMRKESF